MILFTVSYAMNTYVKHCNNKMLYVRMPKGVARFKNLEKEIHVNWEGQ